MNPKFIAAMTLLLTVVFVAVSDSRQRSQDEQKYSDSLLVAPFAKSPKYTRWPDGRQQVTYTTEADYPGEDVLSFLKGELKKRGWKPIPQDFLDPSLPSSFQRGWTFFEDQTQKTRTGVWQWAADWENGSHDVTSYSLNYESPTNSTRGLKDLRVLALYIPAEIAAKMKRDGDKIHRDIKPKK